MPETDVIDWNQITGQAVEQALDEIDVKGIPRERMSTRYALEARGKRYPPKYVVGLAYEKATGKPVRPSEFGGGEGYANDTLRSLGYSIVLMNE